MRVDDLGLVRYADAESLQLRLLDEIWHGAEDIALFLEHPPVITFGRNGGEEFLLGREDALRRAGVDIVKSTRGGKITCHYPGQLVLYPIINLGRWNKSACALAQRGLRGLYYGLEESVIMTMAEFGLDAFRRDSFPGVWLSGRSKICSIGTAVRHGVSYHGLSLNISADTSLFNMITLCGLPDAVPASVSGELGRAVPVSEVKDALKRNFLRLFA